MRRLFFIKEYSELSVLSTDDLKNWTTSKNIVSLLNVSDSSEGIEEDVVPVSRLVYSYALQAILNYDSKVKVGENVLWLHDRTFYALSGNDLKKSSDELFLDKDNLQVFGQLLSLSNSDKSPTGKDAIPNQNRTKTFTSDEMNVSGSRLRHVVDLFNETIIMNDILQSSKMFIRSTLQYRSCSTFKCTWKEAMNSRYINTNLRNDAYGDGVIAPWTMQNINSYSMSGTQTFLLATWSQNYMLLDPHANFAASGPVTCTVSTSTVSVNISWY